MAFRTRRLLRGVIRQPVAHRVAISFGDNVRVASTPLTVSLGLACLKGQVYGETTPSVTGVAVVGGAAADYAINVQLEGRDERLGSPPSCWSSSITHRVPRRSLATSGSFGRSPGSG